VIRQSIDAEQPEGERAAMHRAAADLLALTGASRDEIAAHLLQCPPNSDEWVVERLAEAARSALNDGAPDVAVTYLDRALEEPPADDVPVLSLLGSALLVADIFRAPHVLSDVARRSADPEERLLALRRLVYAHVQTGNLMGAADTCDEAVAVAGSSHRDVVLDLEAQRWFMVSAARGRDPETSRRITEVAGGLQGRSPGERVARQALAVERFFDCAPIAEVVELALPFPADPVWDIEGMASTIPTAAAKMLGWASQWPPARQAFARWTEAMHRQGRVLSVSIGNSFLSEVDRLSGRLREAEAEARTAWEIASVSAGFSTYMWSAMMNLGAALLARGDVEGFVSLTEGFELGLGPMDVPLNPWPIELRAHLRWEQGDLDGAAEDLLALGESLERMGLQNPAYPTWRQDAVEVLAALGRTAEASPIIETAHERACRFGVPHVVGTVLRARATLEPRRQNVATLRESVAQLEHAGPPHELARSELALGAALRRAGDRSEAQVRLQRALELAHSCGAGGVDRRARDELASIGIRPRRPVRTGIDALTASEMKIAKLAAGGLTNKEIAERLFVGLRTVETHLTHVYEKLAIHGRRQVAKALREDPD
jgi:DNA-binding CsgD family transcriptional regulator